MPNAIQSINETREQARKQTSDLCGFDFSAPAELFPSRNKKGRGRITYMRFDTAAEAIRFAVEDMPEFAFRARRRALGGRRSARFTTAPPTRLSAVQ